MIQDRIIFICGLILSSSLIPQIIKAMKIKSVNDFSWITVLLTSNILVIQGITFCTIEMYLSSISMFATALCWYVILILKIIWRKK